MTDQSEPKDTAHTPEAPREPPAAGDDHKADLDQLLKLGRELVSQVRYYLKARADQLKLSLRQFLVLSALGILGLAVAVVIVATAAWLLVTGVAGGLAAMFGGRIWLGNLMAGVLVLSGLGGGAWYGIEMMKHASQRDTIQRYKKLRTEHRAKFGRDLIDEQ